MVIPILTMNDNSHWMWERLSLFPYTLHCIWSPRAGVLYAITQSQTLIRIVRMCCVYLALLK